MGSSVADTSATTNTVDSQTAATPATAAHLQNQASMQGIFAAGDAITKGRPVRALLPVHRRATRTALLIAVSDRVAPMAVAVSAQSLKQLLGRRKA